jgi:hypothetical protein
VVEAIWVLHGALFAWNGTFLGLALMGLSVGGWRARVIAPWHALAGLVAATLQFSSAILTPWVVESGGPLGLIGLAGWIIWVAWLVVYGTALIRFTTRKDPS